MPSIRTILAAALSIGIAFTPSTGEAQTISACYASKSGSMYRVGVVGTPTTCSSGTHVKETWNIQGPKGDPGMSDLAAQMSPGTIPSGSTLQKTVSCPTGKTAISAGFQATASSLSNPKVALLKQIPTYYNGRPTGWIFRIRNDDGVAVSLDLHVLCVTMAS